MIAEVGVPSRRRRWGKWTVPITFTSETREPIEDRAYVRARSAMEAQATTVAVLLDRRYYNVDVTVVPLPDAA